MRNITRDEQIAINKIAKTTAGERQLITLYKPEDESLALFRIQATNLVREITIRHVTKQALTKPCRMFLDQWMADGAGGFGDNVRKFVASLESATGRPLKLPH